MQTEIKRIASGGDILDRPPTGVVLIIASGPRAGEMIGCDYLELAIGGDDDCVVRFSEADYPNVQAKVICQHTPNGWTVRRIRGDTVFINQQSLEEQIALRSGDMIRLSPRGPDVQFNLQSVGFSVKQFVQNHLQLNANDSLVTAETAVAPPVLSKWEKNKTGYVLGVLIIILTALVIFFFLRGERN